MPNEFEVLHTKTSEFVGIVICKNFYYPTDYLDELNNELSSMKITGRLLMDLLLVNGIGSNRFVECCFNGNNIDLSSIKMIDNVPNDIKLTITQYFYENYFLIENSILSKATKYKFKKKLAA